MIDRRICEHRAPRGFTLIELMLAIGILSLILAMLASSFSAVAHSKVHAEGRLMVDREGRALLWQMSDEVRNAVQTRVRAQQRRAVRQWPHGGRRADRYHHAVDLQRRPSPRHHRHDARDDSHLQSGGESASAQLVHAGALAAEWIADDTVAQQSTLLADNVLSLHIRYYDGQKWGESWDSSSLPMGRQLPVAVAIQIQMAAPGGRVMDFASQVIVPMAIQQW